MTTKVRAAMSKLQREIKKRRPFASLHEEAILGLARTNDRVQIEFERLFREHALTPSQYNILRILRGEAKPLPILEIAGRTLTVVPGITGLIDRLERAEMVCRRRCLEDRRVIFVEITKKGLAVLGEVDGPIAALHKKLMGHLAERELRELIHLLDRVREALTAKGS
jgi:DNA-binding MarR family transcriptional regulator